MGRARSRRSRGLSGGAGGTRNRTTGSSKTARTNRRNARLNAKRGTDRTGKLKISWSARDIAQRLTNNKIAKALGLHGLAGKVPKGWKANVNLKTAIKSKIGEKNYRSTSANNPGSGYIPSDVLEYYEKYNPDGKTIKDFEKLYANQLKEGSSLEKAMASNPAETMSYYALLDDGPTQSSQSVSDSLTVKNNNSTKNNKMNSYFDGDIFNTSRARLDVNRLYGELLKRNATFGTGTEMDADYWVEQLKSGKSLSDLIRGIRSGSEYTRQGTAADALGITGSKDSWTADQQAQIDKYVLPGGLTTAAFDELGLNSGDDTWSGTETQTNTILDTLGINAANPTSTSSENILTHDSPYTGDNIITNLQQITDTSTTDTVTGGTGNDTITGGGGSSGVDVQDMQNKFEAQLKEMFSNNWTPYGYGWGGSNTGGVAINRSNASKMGGPYAGNKSSFGRQGYRLATTPQGSNSY